MFNLSEAFTTASIDAASYVSTGTAATTEKCKEERGKVLVIIVAVVILGYGIARESSKNYMRQHCRCIRLRFSRRNVIIHVGGERTVSVGKSGGKHKR